MAKTIEYKTQGTCSRQINITLNDNDIIENVEFIGGCNGNLKGISTLVKGKKRDEVVSLLKGITCGQRPTSCPDQLSKALLE